MNLIDEEIGCVHFDALVGGSIEGSAELAVVAYPINIQQLVRKRELNQELMHTNDATINKENLFLIHCYHADHTVFSRDSKMIRTIKYLITTYAYLHKNIDAIDIIKNHPEFKKETYSSAGDNMKNKTQNKSSLNPNAREFIPRMYTPQLQSPIPIKPSIFKDDYDNYSLRQEKDYEKYSRYGYLD